MMWKVEENSLTAWVGVKAKANRGILIIPKHCKIGKDYNSRKYKDEKLQFKLPNKK